MSDATLTITAKGQVTLKRAILDHLGLRPGDKVEARLNPGGKIELAPVQPKRDISAAFGILHRPGQRVLTIEEMDEMIADAVAEDDERIRRERTEAHPAATAEPRKRVLRRR